MLNWDYSQLNIISKILAGSSQPSLMQIYNTQLNRAVAIFDENPLPVTIGASAGSDAFGRLRASDPFTIFDSKLLFDKGPLLWDESITDVSGSATSTHSTDDAAVTMHADGNGDILVRQTFMRFNYQPGKSQLFFMTGIINSVPNATGRIGAFDANNGIFFESANEELAVVIRKAGSDTRVIQSNWNVDRMDGTGLSGVTIDLTKTQIFVVDFEWLGVGTVRFGFVVNGKIIYVHHAHHANNLTAVYMSTPVLPLRYEVRSTGGSMNLVHICSSVISEGGVEPNGTLHSANIGTTAVNLANSGTRYAMFGIRLKTTHFDTQIDLLNVDLLTSTSQTTLFRWELLLNPTVTGAALSYSDVTNSSVQTAFGNNTQLVTNPNVGTVLTSGYGAGRISEVVNVRNAIRLGANIANTADRMILAITPLSNNQDHVVSVTWLEI